MMYFFWYIKANFVCRLFSSCSGGLSHCRFSAMRTPWGMPASVVIACGLSSCSFWASRYWLNSCSHGLHCSTACVGSSRIRSSPCLHSCRQDSYHWSHQGSYTFSAQHLSWQNFCCCFLSVFNIRVINFSQNFKIFKVTVKTAVHMAR